MRYGNSSVKYTVDAYDIWGLENSHPFVLLASKLPQLGNLNMLSS